MVDAFIDTLELFPRGLVYVGIGIVVLGLGSWSRNFSRPTRSTTSFAPKTTSPSL